MLFLNSFWRLFGLELFDLREVSFDEAISLPWTKKSSLEFLKAD